MSHVTITPLASNETAVEVESTRDGEGRVHFTAYWLASNVGPRGDRYGVRAQCFHGKLRDFERRLVAKGGGMRVLTRPQIAAIGGNYDLLAPAAWLARNGEAG